MSTGSGRPDPSLYIGRLSDGDAFRREAAAWSLGEIGSRRAARPLAGLLLRELSTVERCGYVLNDDIVRTVLDSIRRVGGTEALFALINALLVLVRARRVNDETVAEIIESIAAVGGLHAVREAADRVVHRARQDRVGPGLDTVAALLLERLGLCGDAAVSTLRRLARGGPPALRPYAEHALHSVV